MSGIIITPGTFNPPATPAQAFGMYVFPKTPVATTRRGKTSYQFQSRPAPPPMVEDEGEAVIYFRRDFYTGDCIIMVGSIQSSLATFTLAGGRYANDGDHTPTDVFPDISGINDSGYVMNGSTAYLFADEGWTDDRADLDIGEVTFDPYLFDGGLYYFLRLSLPYSVTVAAATGESVYAVQAYQQTFDPPIQSGLSGAIPIDLAGYTPGSMGSVGGTVSVSTVVILELLRDGAVIDRVKVSINITGTVSPSGGEEDAAAVETLEDAVTIVTAPASLTDTLYGADPVQPAVTAPDIPHMGYARESYAIQGTITLP